MTTSCCFRPREQAGFTLLEALVTIVVISIGLLGLLGLQTVSIADTQSSAARSEASIAADNMSDRIRVNADGAKNKYYDGVSHPAAGPAPAACNATAVCTPKQMSAFDAYQWDTTLGRVLPNGRGYIECSTPDPKNSDKCIGYTITIAWNERNRQTNGASNSSADLCADKAISPITSTISDRCFQTQVRP